MLTDSSDTELAYQFIVGVGYKVLPNLRINLDGRYYGTLNPAFNNNFALTASNVPIAGSVSGSYLNNNISVLASVVYTFGRAAR